MELNLSGLWPPRCRSSPPSKNLEHRHARTQPSDDGGRFSQIVDLFPCPLLFTTEWHETIRRLSASVPRSTLEQWSLAERGIAKASYRVRLSRLSVCDVDVSWSYRLKFCENNFTANFTVEYRAKVTINGLYKVIQRLSIAAKMYDLEWPLSEI